MDECALRERIQDLLVDGRLPRVGQRRLLAGYGDGRVCEACDLQTKPSQVVYEASFGGPQPRTILMHYQCFDLWYRERALCRDGDLHSAA